MAGCASSLIKDFKFEFLKENMNRKQKDAGRAQGNVKAKTIKINSLPLFSVVGVSSCNVKIKAYCRIFTEIGNKFISILVKSGDGQRYCFFFNTKVSIQGYPRR